MRRLWLLIIMSGIYRSTASFTLRNRSSIPYYARDAQLLIQLRSTLNNFPDPSSVELILDHSRHHEPFEHVTLHFGTQTDQTNFERAYLHYRLWGRVNYISATVVGLVALYALCPLYRTEQHAFPKLSKAACLTGISMFFTSYLIHHYARKTTTFAPNEIVKVDDIIDIHDKSEHSLAQEILRAARFETPVKQLPRYAHIKKHRVLLNLTPYFHKGSYIFAEFQPTSATTQLPISLATWVAGKTSALAMQNILDTPKLTIPKIPVNFSLPLGAPQHTGIIFMGKRKNNVQPLFKKLSIYHKHWPGKEGPNFLFELQHNNNQFPPLALVALPEEDPS